MTGRSKKYSLSLLRENVEFDRSILRVTKGTSLEALPEAGGLRYPHKAFVVRNKPSTPRWAGHLRQHFPVDDLENQTSSLVILFEAAERVWALTYGNGFHLVPPAIIEPSFGLRVVANSIDPQEIKSADARTPDVVSRTTRSQVSRGSRIADLGIAVDRELIKHLAGRPTLDSDPDARARRLAGADSLQINADWDLVDLVSHAEFLLEQFRSTTYRDAFSFIDNFRPLRTGDPLITALDSRLAERIDRREIEKLSLAAPEIIDEDRFDHYKVTFRNQSVELPELVLPDIYEFLGSLQADGTDTLAKVHLVAVDGDGQAASTRRELKRYVAAEIDHDNETYMLVAGLWFVVERDYVQRISSRVNALIASSQQHPLPRWKAGLAEGEYNRLAAAQSEWLLLDKAWIPHGGANQKIEFGDLMRADGSALVHVKKMSSSATLSHLWAQGAVASQLYKSDELFQAKIRERFPHIRVDMSDIRLVYAVANDRDGSLADELFFFSKVHLLEQLGTLDLIGCPVDLVKIPMARP